MKKALALVLALVLALSMAVSAFGLKFVELIDQTPEEAEKTVINVVDVKDEPVVYTRTPGTYYVALKDEPWKDVKVTANGNVTAKLIDFDPETMEIKGMDVFFKVTKNGADYATSLEYEYAKAYCKDLNNGSEVTYYAVAPQTNVFVIEITVEDNYTAHYTEGSIVIEATLDKKAHKGEIKVINDVVIFEYEELKWTAQNFEDDAALTVGQKGYSDFGTSESGYSANKDAYNETLLRAMDDAAVVSTTGFRAIEGEDLLVKSAGMDVVLKDIVKGQKGVNFKGYVKEVFVDVADEDGVKNKVFDIDVENLTAIEFGFYGDQIVKGEYEITLALPYNWYTLREAFGLKVEEDDIISYYVVDENGKVVGGKEVDYMTADLYEEVEFTVKGSNSALGQYKIVLEVPAAEAGEANPNTGAESVVGVVAALAVVSVATAAAVSLKK